MKYLRLNTDHIRTRTWAWQFWNPLQLKILSHILALILTLKLLLLVLLPIKIIFVLIRYDHIVWVWYYVLFSGGFNRMEGGGNEVLLEAKCSEVRCDGSSSHVAKHHHVSLSLILFHETTLKPLSSFNAVKYPKIEGYLELSIGLLFPITSTIFFFLLWWIKKF